MKFTENENYESLLSFSFFKGYFRLCFINQFDSSVCVLYVSGVLLGYFQNQNVKFIWVQNFCWGGVYQRLNESCIPTVDNAWFVLINHLKDCPLANKSRFGLQHEGEKIRSLHLLVKFYLKVIHVIYIPVIYLVKKP